MAIRVSHNLVKPLRTLVLERSSAWLEHLLGAFENTESTQRRYALQRRAVTLGRAKDRIVVIDHGAALVNLFNTATAAVMLLAQRKYDVKEDGAAALQPRYVVAWE